MKVVFRLMDKECHSSGVVADVAQIHPKTNREGLAQKEESTRLVSAGNGSSVATNSFNNNPEISRCGNRFYTFDCDA